MKAYSVLSMPRLAWFWLLGLCLLAAPVSAQVPTPTPSPTPLPSPTPGPDPSPSPSPGPSPSPTPEVFSATLIYRMEFRREGLTNNNPLPRFGYLFVDSNSGAVTSIVCLVDPFTGKLYYLTDLLTGKYFQVTSPLRRRVVDVVAANSGTPGNDFAALQMTGSERRTIPFRRGSVELAPNLSGFLMMSAGDTPSDTAAFTADAIVGPLGFVGNYVAKARFQRTASRAFQRRGLSVAEITAVYTEQLKSMGIDSGSGPNPGPSPAPSPSPSPGPIPVPIPAGS